MEGYAEEKATNPFTAKYSCQNSTLWDRIRSESELPSSVRCQQTTVRDVKTRRVGVVAA